MPRAMRAEYPGAGAIYHAMEHADRWEDIFVNDVDRHDPLKTLAEACQKTDWQVHAYCLMRNNFHLNLHPVRADLLCAEERLSWLSVAQGSCNESCAPPMFPAPSFCTYP